MKSIKYNIKSTKTNDIKVIKNNNTEIIKTNNIKPVKYNMKVIKFDNIKLKIEMI